MVVLVCHLWADPVQGVRVDNLQALPPSGHGWAVEPRQGRLGMSLSVATVPGPVPVPVGLRLQGAFTVRTHAYALAEEVAQGRRMVSRKVQHRFTAAQGVCGAIHFGYLAPRREFLALDDFNKEVRVLLEDAVQVLEDGTVMRPEDWMPFESYHASFTLPADFGLGPQEPGKVRVGLEGKLAMYEANPGDLGRWRAQVESHLPVGFGAAPASYTVVMDKDQARIFAQLPAIQASVPLLWLDRFGHGVTFTWTRRTEGLPPGVTAVDAVEVRNHLGKGVQVQWAGFSAARDPGLEAVQDLARVTFLGFQAPAALLRGYPGLSAAWPSELGEVGPLRVLPWAGAGPGGRPTTLRLGPSEALGIPFWSRGIPAPPADGTLPAAPMEWTWEYDPHHAEVVAFTDPAAVRTRFTYQPFPAPLPGDAPRLRTLARAISMDAIQGQTLSRSWVREGGEGRPDLQFRETFGPLEGASRVLEYTFAGPQVPEGFEVARLEVKGTDGTRSLATQSPGPFSRAGASRIVEVARSGESPLKRIETRDHMGRPIKEETCLDGRRIRVVTTTYAEALDKLDPRRLLRTVETRYDPATGAALPEVLTRNWTYDERGFPVDAYRTGTRDGKALSEGVSTIFDGEGRPVETRPYGVAPAPWTLARTWMPGSWAAASETTWYQDPGNPAEGILFQAVEARDSADRPLRALDARGVLTTRTFDIYGRVCSSVTEGQGGIRFAYDPDQRGRTLTQASRGAIRETLDGFGRVIRRDLPDGRAEVFTFDDQGRPASSRWISSRGKVQDPSLFRYDALDRPVSRTRPGGATEILEYGAEGVRNITWRTRVADSGAEMLTELRVEERLDGDLVKVQDPDGSITVMAYDGQGHLLSSTLTPAGGGPAQVRSFLRDPLGRVLGTTQPETGTVRFEDFDALGQPCTLVEASGRVRRVTRDGLGRVRRMVGGGAMLAWIYQGQDLVRSESRAGANFAARTFEYSGPGRPLTRETMELSGLQVGTGYGYDAQGNLATLTYPSGRVVGYVRDDLGRITGITNNGVSLVARVSFNEWGQREQMDFASGAFSRWTLDGQGLRSVQWDIGRRGGVFPDGRRAYAWGPGERLTQAGEWSLAHDPQGRLQQATFQSRNAGDPGYSTFHGYDGYGNPIAHALAGNAPASMVDFDLAPMPLNRMPDLARDGAVPTGWITNRDGEATSVGISLGSGPTLDLAWDGLGRLAWASGPACRQDYTYDGLGMRVALRDAREPARSRVFIHSSGGLLLQERGGTGGWKRDVVYLEGRAIAEVDAGGVHELHCDHLGTPRIITKGSTGEIEGRQAFGPYGEAMVNTSPDNTYTPLTGYTGHVQTDATGLIHMRGRFYSPAWHRFVSPDPVADPGQWNRMAYVGGSPFLATDPTGHWIIRDLTNGSGGGLMIDGGGATVCVWGERTDVERVEISRGDWGRLNGRGRGRYRLREPREGIGVRGRVQQRKFDGSIWTDKRDYVSISVGAYLGLGVSRSLTIDKYGGLYWGGGTGSGIGGKGFSVTQGTLLNGYTDPTSLRNTISGTSTSWQINAGAAFGVTTSSNGVVAVEYGGGPGLGFSGNRTNRTRYLGNPLVALGNWIWGK